MINYWINFKNELLNEKFGKILEFFKFFLKIWEFWKNLGNIWKIQKILEKFVNFPKNRKYFRNFVKIVKIRRELMASSKGQQVSSGLFFEQVQPLQWRLPCLSANHILMISCIYDNYGY
jgi:hypothetical protein